MKKIFICLVMTAFAVSFANAHNGSMGTMQLSRVFKNLLPREDAIHCFTIRCHLDIGGFLDTDFGTVTLCCGHIRVGSQSTIGCYVANRPGTTNEPNTVTVTVDELYSKSKIKPVVKVGSPLTVKNSSIEDIEGEKFMIRSGDYTIFDDKGAPSVNLVLVSVK